MTEAIPHNTSLKIEMSKQSQEDKEKAHLRKQSF